MIKKFLIFPTIISLFLPLLFTRAGAQATTAWQINDFTSQIELQKDSSLVINETIDVTFNTPKHGIYRTIPVKYKDEWRNSLSLRIEVISVIDKEGNNYQTKIIREGKNLKIRIGDPDRTVIGHFVYDIKYTVKRALIFKDNTAEIYWNVTGTEWEVPIEKVSGKVVLPSEIDRDIETYCWTGKYGSTEKNCQISSNKNIINFSDYDFLTISVKFPTGVIQQPIQSQEITWFLEDNLIWIIVFILPILVFIFMFLLWFFKGRDPAGRGTIIAEFESPHNLRPTEVGLLLDNKIQTKDITATIVDLAVRGYLKIIEKEKKKYNLVLLKKDFSQDKGLKPYEVSIISEIFGSKEQVSLDDLKNKFYRYLRKIKKQVSSNLLQEGYYKRDPIKVRNFWILLSTILYLAVFLSRIGIAFNISGVISVTIILLFGLEMTKRTPKGAETLEKIKGLQLYIDTAEKYRVKFQEKENIFEKFLPYAMVFGLASKWAKAFEGIYKEPPSWYEGYHGTFTTLYFGNSMNSFDGSVRSAVVSKPSSGTGAGGTGGFSGGGFGGGGGGSW
jgi:uncharacterized membrane protein